MNKDKQQQEKKTKKRSLENKSVYFIANNVIKYY